MTSRRLVDEATAWPPTDVIVSPEARPAPAAGEPERTPSMVAPGAAGADA